jgi:hypothetical protein
MIQGGTTCFECPSGYYSTLNGSTSCTLCFAGNYSTGSSCVSCSGGRYSSSNGSIVCDLCASGYSSNVGSSTCHICPSGFYSTSGSPCSSCIAGFFSNITGQSVCRACDVGLYADAANSTLCTLCQEGKFNSAPESSYCTFCSSGRYSTIKGVSDCSECLNGTFADVEGSSICSPCKQGRFSNSFASKLTNCLSCPMAFYANESGLALCFRCDPLTDTQSEGSTSKSACLCQEGYFGNVLIEQCRPCAQGPAFKCPTGSIIPWISPGYFRGGPSGEGANIAYTCTPTVACIKTEYDPTTSCGQGYTGFLCGDCSDQYYKFSGACRKCPGDVEKWVTVSAGALILFILIWRIMDQKTQLPIDIRVTVQALQMIALFPNISVKWPPLLTSLFQAVSIFVSILQIYSPLILAFVSRT